MTTTVPHIAAQTASAATRYRERIEALRVVERDLQREHVRLGYLRLVFGIAVVILLLPPIPPVFLALAGFGLAARVHQRVLARLAETRRALLFYEYSLARVEDRWAGLRLRDPRVDREASLYAADLDLFGPASLFEYLCEARTSLGEEELARWLLCPATIADALCRQQAVADLRPRLALREAFAAARGPALAHVPGEELTQWAEHEGSAIPWLFRGIAPLLVLATVGAAVHYATAHTPVLLTLLLLVDVAVTFSFRQAFGTVFTTAEKASRFLRTVGELLKRVEAEEFGAEPLQVMQARLRVGGRALPEAVSSLAQLVTWTEARSNYLVRILDAPLLYSLQFALALQAWKRRFGPALGGALEVLGEFEALLSLAAYSFEHPQDPFPAFDKERAVFEASGLGHPLLSEATCVRNDVRLDMETALLLVSGSNMSGKSTLMRSVGINTVLALAGAPVRARSLVISRLAVSASIQVNDSLLAGRSRFYAEILRLRAITEAARKAQVLFLIDEVLAGTNSSDRAAGAGGLIRDLLRHGAIGLLSTHDLALTTMAAEYAGRVRNVHFEDEIANGKLHFSYVLQDGVVQRSNGLDLMRLIGLDV